MLKPPDDPDTVARVTAKNLINPTDELDSTGIYVVDDRRLDRVDEIYLSPGEHTLYYSCPGWLFVDYPPKITITVEAGKAYEVICDSSRNEAWIDELKPITQ